MVTLTHTLDTDAADSALAQMLHDGEDLTPLMQNIGMLLEASAKFRIRSSNTSPENVSWPKSLRAKEDGGKTLFDSGRLEESIQYIAGPNQVEVGSNVIYAAVHQTGHTITAKAGGALHFALPGGGYATVGSVTIPARPYLGVSDIDEEDIQDAVAHHFDLAGPVQ